MEKGKEIKLCTITFFGGRLSFLNIQLVGQFNSDLKLVEQCSAVQKFAVTPNRLDQQTLGPFVAQAYD